MVKLVTDQRTTLFGVQEKYVVVVVDGRVGPAVFLGELKLESHLVTLLVCLWDQQDGIQTAGNKERESAGVLAQLGNSFCQLATEVHEELASDM